MENRAGRNKNCVWDLEARPIGKIHGRFAEDFASPNAAHLHNRSSKLNRYVIVGRLDRDGRYLSKGGTAKQKRDCAEAEYSTNHNKS